VKNNEHATEQTCETGCVTNEMAIRESHRLHMGMPCWNTTDLMYGYVNFPSLKLHLKKNK